MALDLRYDTLYAALQYNMRQQVPPMELWTVDEAAHYLKLHPETLRRKTRDKQVPAVKVGPFWRYHPERLRAWVDAGCPSQLEQSSLFDLDRTEGA